MRFLILLTTFFSFQSFISAQNSSAVKIREQTKESIVKIIGKDNKGNVLKSGTGVVVDNRGTILTNAHNFISSGTLIPDYLIVEGINDTCSAFIIYINLLDDWMFINTASKKLKKINISTQIPNLGEDIYVFSCPAGLPFIIDKGVFSYITNDGSSYYNELINKKQKFFGFSGYTNPGSSGGALLNNKGELIGIITQKPSYNANYSYAIPITEIDVFTITQYVNKLKGNGELLELEEISSLNSPNEYELPKNINLLQKDIYNYILNEELSDREIYSYLKKPYPFYCINCDSLFSMYYFYESCYAYLNNNLELFKESIIGALINENTNNHSLIEIITFGILAAYEKNDYYLAMSLNVKLIEITKNQSINKGFTAADSINIAYSSFLIGDIFFKLSMNENAILYWEQALNYDNTLIIHYKVLNAISLGSPYYFKSSSYISAKISVAEMVFKNKNFINILEESNINQKFSVFKNNISELENKIQLYFNEKYNLHNFTNSLIKKQVFKN